MISILNLNKKNNFTTPLQNKVHQYSPSFCAADKTGLERSPKNDVFQAQNKDFLHQDKTKISETVLKTLKNPKLVIGYGCEAFVFKIPDEPYCIRRSRDFSPEDLNNEISFDISKKNKVNHVVAKMGDTITIMNYIEGKTIFDCDSKSDIANLPIDSYKKLLKQIITASDNGMLFDYAPKNVIYNKDKKSLTAIDFYDSYDIDYVSLENIHSPLCQMFSSLTSTSEKNTISESDYKKICAKTIYAALTDFEQDKKPSMTPALYDFERLMYKANKAYKLPVQASFLTSQLNKLKNLKQKELQGKDVSIELNGCLKFCKALTKQIFES